MRAARNSSGQPSRRRARAGKHTAAAAALAALVAVLAACSGGGAESGASDGHPGFAAEEGAAADSAAETPASSPDLAGGAAGGGEAEEADREIITVGSASLVVDDPVAAAAEVVRLAEQAGGRVEARNEWRTGDGQTTNAWLRVRVPAASMTATVDALGEIGEVQHLDVSREDVTATGRDLDARIAALTTSTERLSELLARAENVEDLLGIERELSSRQADLDSLRAQRTALSDQVAMSTLHVDLRTRATAGVGPDGFLGGLAAGWDALGVAARAALVALGAALPWLVVAGVVALAVLGVRRRVRRRRTGSAVAGTPQPAAGDDAG